MKQGAAGGALSTGRSAQGKAWVLSTLLSMFIRPSDEGQDTIRKLTRMLLAFLVIVPFLF